MLLFEFERSRIQLIIRTLHFEELFVRAALYYAAVVEHHYCVAVADGGKAVRYYEYRSALHQLIHTLLDELFRSGID